MARIRTIKPEFFRHEALQDLEAANIGACCMLVFQGLWTQCDNQGIFPYKPRQLKLDVLPFLNFDMQTTLDLLEEAGFLFSYTIDDKKYGIIPTLPEHQRFNGKEAGEEGKKYPLPPEKISEAGGKQWGSNGEAPEKISEAGGKHVPAQEMERSKGKEYRERSIGNENKTPPYPPAGGVCVKNSQPKTTTKAQDKLFDQFWKVYPKKVSKGSAEKAWMSINPNEQLLASMIATIERAMTSDDWKRENGKFIPYPATWLNAKRWMDEQPAVNSSEQEGNKWPLFIAGDERWLKNPVYDDD